MPTGNAAAQDTFPGRLDPTVNKPRYVDLSVQPGDGGWGVMFEGNAFWLVNRIMFFGSGSYLANPRDENNTLDPDSARNQHDDSSECGTRRQLGSGSIHDSSGRLRSHLEGVRRVTCVADGRTQALRPLR